MTLALSSNTVLQQALAYVNSKNYVAAYQTVLTDVRANTANPSEDDLEVMQWLQTAINVNSRATTTDALLVRINNVVAEAYENDRSIPVFGDDQQNASNAVAVAFFLNLNRDNGELQNIKDIASSDATAGTTVLGLSRGGWAGAVPAGFNNILGLSQSFYYENLPHSEQVKADLIHAVVPFALVAYEAGGDGAVFSAFTGTLASSMDANPILATGTEGVYQIFDQTISWLEKSGTFVGDAYSSLINDIAGAFSGNASSSNDAGIAAGALAIAAFNAGLIMTGGDIVGTAFNAAAKTLTDWLEQNLLGKTRSFTGEESGADPLPDGNALSDGSYVALVSGLFNHAATDPVLLDLSSNGSGVQLVPLSQSNAYFDLHDTGFAVHTAWVGAQTGILVQPNADGTVTNASNLIGAGAQDGYTALEALDTNHDGVINASDVAFSSLRVWVDANGDGKVEAGELKTLSQLGITSINLPASDAAANSTASVTQIATFTRNGGTAEVAEASFQNSQVDSQFTQSFTLDPETLLLPNLRGYGTLPPLYAAMSMDSTLKGLVKNLTFDSISHASSWGDQVTNILYEWAGVTNVNPNSRGGLFDARQLGVLEAFDGETYNHNGVSYPQYALQVFQLQIAWSDLLSEVETRLLVQGPMASAFPGVGYDYDTDKMTGSINWNAVVSNTPQTAYAAGQYWQAVSAIGANVALDTGISASTEQTNLQNAFNQANLPFTLSEVQAGDAILGKGDGTIVASDIPTILALGNGLTSKDVILQTDAQGDLTVSLDTGDSITFKNDLSVVPISVQYGVGVASGLDQILFADGSSVGLNSIYYDTFTWTATATNKALTGTDFGNNLFNLAAGGDSVVAGDKSNYINFDKGDGQASVSFDAPSFGGSHVTLGADVADSDIRYEVDTQGDLTVKIISTGDTLFLKNDLYWNGVSLQSEVSDLRFGDGTSTPLAATGVYTWQMGFSNLSVNDNAFAGYTFQGWGYGKFEATGANDILTLKQSGESLVVTGQNDTVYDDIGDSVKFGGNGNAEVVYGANGTETIAGNGNKISLYSSGNTATGLGFNNGINDGSAHGGNAIILQGSGDYANLYIGNDTVTLASNSSVYIDASGNLVNATGGYGNVFDQTGSGGNAIALSATANYTSLALYGASDGVNDAGLYDTSNAYGGKSVFTLNGAHDGVNDAGSGSNVTLNGSNNWENIYDATNQTTLAGMNNAAYIDQTGAFIIVTGTGDTADDFSGGSNKITLQGSGNYATTYGNGDTIQLQGSGNAVYLDSANDIVTVTGKASVADDYGKGGSIIAYGADNTYGALYGANDVATLTGASDTVDLYGSNGNFTLSGIGDVAHDSGAHDAITLQGSGNYAILYGSQAAVTMAGSGNTVVIYGGGNQVSVTGTNGQAGDDGSQGGNSITLAGSGNTANLYNAGDFVTLAGNGNTAYVNGATPNNVAPGTITFNGANVTAELARGVSENIFFNSGASGTLKLDAAEGFSGTVAGLAAGDAIDLADFSFSGNPVITSVAGSGASGTNTILNLTDGSFHGQLSLFNQYAFQFATTSAAYGLASDHNGANPGTLFHIGH